MKINGIPYKVQKDTIIELEEEDRVGILVPASVGRTCVYLEVNQLGMLDIAGGSAIIGKIAGLGMRQKFI